MCSPETAFAIVSRGQTDICRPRRKRRSSASSAKGTRGDPECPCSRPSSLADFTNPRRFLLIEKCSRLPNRRGGMGMTRIPSGLIIAIALASVSGNAISAQDKYTLQVPNGLAFSEFKGYEDWQSIFRQSDWRSHRSDPRQSRDDRGLPGRRPRQRQTFPRRRQDGEDPLECEKERGGPRTYDGGRAPCTTLISCRRIARDSRTPADGDTPSLTTTPRPTELARLV